MSDKKKRYVGFLLKNGKRIYKVTGFESVRRDTSPITEFMQEAVFKMILNGSSQKEVESFIKDLDIKCRTGIIPLAQLGLPKGFSKGFNEYKNENIWIRGLKYSNDNLGTHLDHFSEVMVFHIKYCPEDKPVTDVVCVDEECINVLNGFIIDWNEQMNKVIGSKFQNIKDMVGWIDLKQKTFGDF
jgi:DNA polymerase elongation subunit (family B)